MEKNPFVLNCPLPGISQLGPVITLGFFDIRMRNKLTRVQKIKGGGRYCTSRMLHLNWKNVVISAPLALVLSFNYVRNVNCCEESRRSFRDCFFNHCCPGLEFLYWWIRRAQDLWGNSSHPYMYIYKYDAWLDFEGLVWILKHVV